MCMYEHKLGVVFTLFSFYFTAAKWLPVDSYAILFCLSLKKNT